MRINNSIRAFIFIVMLLTFVSGVIHLFVLRFKAGDVYPAYSSLRSDPLGTRVFYESLSKLENIAVRRNYQPLRVLQLEPETTLLHLGNQVENWEWISVDVIKVIDRLTAAGGRMIISFLPVKEEMAQTEKPGPSERKIRQKDEADLRKNDAEKDSEVIREDRSSEAGDPHKGRVKEQNDPTGDEHRPNRFVSLKKHWGVGFEMSATILSKDEPRSGLSAHSEIGGYPPVITWHTNHYFAVLDTNWRVLYVCNGYPVIIERQFGRGSVVMSTDSFFVSNEALWSERHPQLLAGMIGQNSKVVFDEEHFGIAERPGVAGLIRKFRFHWFFAGLILLALLFVWKNSVCFVPPNAQKHANVKDVRSDKDFTQGFIALLRRNITTSDILPVCIREWKETTRGERRVSAYKLERINAILARESGLSKKQKDPVGEYQKISSIISKENNYE